MKNYSLFKKRANRIWSKSVSFRSFFCVSLAFLCSCTRNYSIVIDTYADKQCIPQGIRSGSSFAIFSAKDENPLFSKELAQKIAQVLNNRNYNVESIEKADYVLLFKSSISSTTQQISVAKHIPGETQTKNRTKKSGESYSETITSSGTTVYVPEDYTFFTGNLNIYVCDAESYRRDKKEKQIWSGFAISSGKENDLRQLVDYLLIATFSYFGEDTKKSVKIDMAQDNEQVRQLRSTSDRRFPEEWAPCNSSNKPSLIEESREFNKERDTKILKYSCDWN